MAEPLTRRRALGLVLAGAAGGLAAMAGCSSDDSDEASDAADGPDRSSGLSGGEGAGGGERAVVYASPSCGCCGQYAEYLGTEGYDVDLQRTEEVDRIRTDAGVPEDAAGCHTTIIGDYAVEGHVPVEAIAKLLEERPAVDGISLPGMPTGSPGMSGPKEGPFEIVSFEGGSVAPFTAI